MYRGLDHPEIEWCLRTGYPSWMQEGDTREEYDEDSAYEESREEAIGWQ